MTGMATFIQRREESCLKFGIKCASNPRTSLIFPRNDENPHNVRNKEQFHVNFARTEAYKRSPIVYIQRLLNQEMGPLEWIYMCVLTHSGPLQNLQNTDEKFQNILFLLFFYKDSTAKKL